MERELNLFEKIILMKKRLTNNKDNKDLKIINSIKQILEEFVEVTGVAPDIKFSNKN